MNNRRRFPLVERGRTTMRCDRADRNGQIVDAASSVEKSCESRRSIGRSQLIGLLRALGTTLDSLDRHASRKAGEPQHLHRSFREIGLSARSSGLPAFGALCLELSERIADQSTLSRRTLVWLKVWCSQAEHYVSSPASRRAAEVLMELMNRPLWKRAPGQRATEALVEALLKDF